MYTGRPCEVLVCCEWVFPMWAWSGSREQFLHCGLRKFRHSRSSVCRWYTQLDRRRFVYDTYKTMKATRMRHGWVHMFITHRRTLTLQLYNFDLFRTCRTSSFCTVAWQLANFNWHDASRGPSAIAELLVIFDILSPLLKFNFNWWVYQLSLIKVHGRSERRPNKLDRRRSTTACYCLTPFCQMQSEEKWCWFACFV